MLMGMSKNMHSFTDHNFEAEVLKSDLPVMIDFTAAWCGPCKLLSPIVEKLADELEGRVKVGKVDIDSSPNITARFGIRGVPTVMVFHRGELRGQHVGLTNRETLLKLVEDAS
jgi:thioredoxin 1